MALDRLVDAAIEATHPVSFARGVSRSSRTLSAGCDGRGWRARRVRQTRTAKSCGPDIPTLISNGRRCFRIAACDGDNKAGLRGEHEGNRKTIRAGNAGRNRCDRGDYARVLLFFAREAAGANRAPGIPCAL